MLSDREVYILSRLYDWEEPIENIDSVIASELNITKERVRQISIRALRKMKRVVYPGFNPIASIRFIIDDYAIPAEKKHPGKTISRLCFMEMDGLQTSKMVRLLAYLCLRKKSEIKETILGYQLQKRVIKEEYKKQRRLEWERFKKDSQFSQFLDTYVVWFDNVKYWKKEDFDGRMP